MAINNVCIIGSTGNVGSELVKQIESYDTRTLEEGDENHPGHRNPTRIVGLANTRGAIFKASGIRNGAGIKGEEYATSGRTLGDARELIDMASHRGLDGDMTFVDVTASKEMLAFHQQAVRAGFGVVTANKNPLAFASFEEFQTLTADRKLYRFNASVMAGGDAVPLLQDSVDTSARINHIRGCFSGTLGYICSQLESGASFSGIVQDAHDKKYTEPHPWDDLNGLDVSRKLLILARSAGLPVEMDDLQREPFIPEQYGEITDVADFLRSMQALDDAFASRVGEAQSRGNVLRYVADMTAKEDRRALSIQLKEIPRTTEIGGLKGTSNIVDVSLNINGDPTPITHKIITPGAGVGKTAWAIRRDLLQLQRQRRHG